MKRGEMKQKIVQILNERGPMTLREIMYELDEPWNAVFSGIKSLSNAGRIHPVEGSHKSRYVWALC